MPIAVQHDASGDYEAAYAAAAEAAAKNDHASDDGAVGNRDARYTADEDDLRIRQTYGANYDRLVEVKRKYDPENLFRSNRNVAP